MGARSLKMLALLASGHQKSPGAPQARHHGPQSLLAGAKNRPARLRRANARMHSSSRRSGSRLGVRNMPVLRAPHRPSPPWRGPGMCMHVRERRGCGVKSTRSGRRGTQGRGHVLHVHGRRCFQPAPRRVADGLGHEHACYVIRAAVFNHQNPIDSISP